MLVANKKDQFGDRMVSVADGERRYREIDCVGFREISVRESIDEVSHFTSELCIIYSIYKFCYFFLFDLLEFLIFLNFFCVWM